MKKNIWLYLLIFFLPWQTRYIFQAQAVDYTSYSLYLSAIFVLLVIIFNIKKVNEYKKIPTWLYWLAAFDVMAFASIFWALDWRLALYRYLWLLAAELLLIFWPKDYRAAYVWLGTATLQAVLALVQFAYQKTWAASILGWATHNPQTLGIPVVETNIRWLRAYGSFDHPNILGGYLALSLIVGLFLWLQRKHDKWYKLNHRTYDVLIFSALFLVFTAILISFSRAALLGLILGGGYLLFMYWSQAKLDKKESRLVLMILKALFFIPWLGLAYLWSWRLWGDHRLEIISNHERLAGIKEALVMIGHNFFGYGLGNYTVALQKFIANQANYFYQPVHNIWLLLAVEGGLWLPVLLLGFLFYFNYKKQNHLLMALLLVLLPISLFDHWLFSLATGTFLLFSILALANGVAGLEKD